MPQVKKVFKAAKKTSQTKAGKKHAFPHHGSTLFVKTLKK